MLRIPKFLALLENELIDDPDLHADLSAVLKFEPQSLIGWISLMDFAEHKLGDLETLAKWITCPHPDLDGRAPATLVGTPNGIERARQLLEQYPLPPWRQ
ncbi:antitoxin Xre/MbcA/ParS toxin-binding domain-containing protein [Chitinibacter sp. S2-10]|uniref:antitoxin Xre/MbcA/ParS toxin-binding domain-containing protein n=1 Tax=Chitinibacter sp. S2-10 TaxID=3373597 RepID=UPI0039778176